MRTRFYHDCQICGAEDQFPFGDGETRCNEAYLWNCDACGSQVRITFTGGGRLSHQEATGRHCHRTLALLAFRGEVTFAFIYRGCAWSEQLKDGRPDGRYFYEEHTCPTNLFPCEEIVVGGEVDPHGCFDLIEEHLITGPGARDKDEVLAELIEKAKAFTTTGQDDEDFMGQIADAAGGN